MLTSLEKFLVSLSQLNFTLDNVGISMEATASNVNVVIPYAGDIMTR